jgi:hypothetical protein
MPVKTALRLPSEVLIQLCAMDFNVTAEQVAEAEKGAARDLEFPTWEIKTTRSISALTTQKVWIRICEGVTDYEITEYQVARKQFVARADA